MEIILRNGLKVQTKNKLLALDSNGTADVHLISHAHSDHVVKRKDCTVFCSPETASLIMHRYSNSFNFVKSVKGVEMLDSGHIYGSKAFFIQNGDSLLYTGDFSDQNRLFLKKAKLKKADNLIIETTYGDPVYKFPNQEQELQKARDWIKDTLKTNSVLLLNYSLGKAQLVSKIVEDVEPRYSHWTIQNMNKAHNFLGLDMPLFESLDLSKNHDKNFVYLLPPHLMPTFGRGIKKKFDMKVAAFSGWVNSPFYKFRLGADAGFAISDHCDFKGLLETVKKVNPKKVYTIHGFSETFAHELRKQGYTAKALD